MWLDVAIVLGKTLFFIVFVLTFMALLMWMEHKQSAVMQDRLGINRASILGFRAFGFPHIVAHALKMIFKEDFVPPGGDRILHMMAPFIAKFFALMTFAAIPFGDSITIAGREIELLILPLNVGSMAIWSPAATITRFSSGSPPASA